MGGSAIRMPVADSGTTQAILVNLDIFFRLGSSGSGSAPRLNGSRRRPRARPSATLSAASRGRRGAVRGVGAGAGASQVLPVRYLKMSSVQIAAASSASWSTSFAARSARQVTDRFRQAPAPAPLRLRSPALLQRRLFDCSGCRCRCCSGCRCSRCNCRRCCVCRFRCGSAGIWN